MNLPSLFIPVFYTLLQLLFLMALGFYLARYRGWDRQFFKPLSRFIVKIALPLYFFVRVSRTDIVDVKRGMLLPLVALILTLLGILISSLIFSFIKIPKTDKRAAIGLSSFGNSGYIPITLIEIFPLTLPLVTELFNVQVSILYVGTYLLAQSPLLWSVGNFLVSGSGERIKPRDFISAPLLGILAGLLVVVFNIQGPLFNPRLPFLHIYRALERLSQVTLPMIMLSLGSMIANLSHFEGKSLSKKGRELARTALTISGIRFVIFPAIFLIAYFTFLRQYMRDPVMLWVIFLEMHIPPATNLSVMAQQAGVNEDSVSFSLLFTYLAYLILLPLYLMVFLNLPGILG